MNTCSRPQVLWKETKKRWFQIEQTNHLTNFEPKLRSVQGGGSKRGLKSYQVANQIYWEVDRLLMIGDLRIGIYEPCHHFREIFGHNLS